MFGTLFRRSANRSEYKRKKKRKSFNPNPRESILRRHFPYYPKIVLSWDSFDNFTMVQYYLFA